MLVEAPLEPGGRGFAEPVHELPEVSRIGGQGQRADALQLGLGLGACSGVSLRSSKRSWRSASMGP